MQKSRANSLGTTQRLATVGSLEREDGLLEPRGGLWWPVQWELGNRHRGDAGVSGKRNGEKWPGFSPLPPSSSGVSLLLAETSPKPADRWALEMQPAGASLWDTEQIKESWGLYLWGKRPKAGTHLFILSSFAALKPLSKIKVTNG